MASDQIEITPGARLWLLSDRYPTRRAVIEGDHLMLLTASGYSDTIRRILFNRVERICVSTGRRFSGRVWLALLLVLIDLLVMLAATHVSIGAVMKTIVLILVGWPIPILVYWLVHSILNPIHQLYVVRDGRTHVIKLTLSSARFAAFYAELAHRIREYQSKFPSAQSARVENSAMPSTETSRIDMPANESGVKDAPLPPATSPPSARSDAPH